MNLPETLRKYPGAAVVAATEVVATGIVITAALEGHPMPVHELLGFYSFMTFYVGIPAGIVTQGVLYIVDFIKGKKAQFPQSPEFPQTPNLK